jgi:hypothetical protein
MRIESPSISLEVRFCTSGGKPDLSRGGHALGLSLTMPVRFQPTELGCRVQECLP